jgi:hypothetical protein
VCLGAAFAGIRFRLQLSAKAVRFDPSFHPEGKVQIRAIAMTGMLWLPRESLGKQILPDNRASVAGERKDAKVRN